MTLPVALTERQARAAGKVHDWVDSWKAADRVLEYLAETVPRNTQPDQVPLKAAALNQLYRTNVYDLHSMAAHIRDVFCQEPVWEEECALVERIPHLEASGREHESFSAKYCYFFVDSQLFPPYDKHARRTVRMHLGPGRYRCSTGKQTYRNFYTDVANLRANLSLNQRCGNSTTTFGCGDSGRHCATECALALR